MFFPAISLVDGHGFTLITPAYPKDSILLQTYTLNVDSQLSKDAEAIQSCIVEYKNLVQLKASNTPSLSNKRFLNAHSAHKMVSL